MTKPVRSEAGSGVPSVYWLGEVQLRAAVPDGAGEVTATENAASDAEAPLLSVTVMRMFDQVPGSSGVQVSAPVTVSNRAAAGLPEMDHVSASPSASVAVGVKL